MPSQLDIRDVDVVFTLIGVFTSRRVDPAFIIQKYGFILFSDRIKEPDCLIFADIVLEIYTQLQVNTLSNEQAVVVLNYLFSVNGIMAPHP